MSRLLLAAVAALLSLSLQGCFLKKGAVQGHTGPQPARGVCSAMNSHSHRMSCGEGVQVCGVLTLETGMGSGAYRRPEPVVHGLWPQTGNFGNSKCEAPEVNGGPQRIYPCFNTQGSSSSASWFQRHEWEKHGVCAGVDDADDFFQQVCALSTGPLQVMEGARAAHMDLVDIASQLQRSGYCVFNLGTNSQVQLSACKDSNDKWHLADVRSFHAVCGNGGSGGGGGGGGGGSAGGVCVSGHKGPSCRRDTDCFGVSGCLRCAASGYCTNVPLRSLGTSRFQDLLLQSSLQSAVEGGPPLNLTLLRVTAAFACLLTLATALLLVQRWARASSDSSTTPLMTSL